MADPPASVKAWFKSRYSHLQFNEEWLRECHDYLKQAHPSLPAGPLLKKMESQLLLSNLAVSTVHHDGLLPPYEGQAELLINTSKQGILVQVLEVLEIGRSALELLKLHRERREDRRVLAEHGRAILRADMHVDPTQEDGPDQPDDPANNKAFPRAMLRLRVSDGFHDYVATERKQVNGLSLDDTPLGCKLLLRDIRCLRGTLMLDNATCVVVGGSIRDLDAQRDELLEELLLARIEGREGAQKENERPPPPQARSASPPAPARAPLIQARQAPHHHPPQNQQPEPPRKAPPRAPPVQNHRPSAGSSVQSSSKTEVASGGGNDAVQQRRGTTSSSSITLVGNVKEEEDELEFDEELEEDELYMLIQEEESRRPSTSTRRVDQVKAQQRGQQRAKKEEKIDELADFDDDGDDEDDDFDEHALDALREAEEQHVSKSKGRQQAYSTLAESKRAKVEPSNRPAPASTSTSAPVTTHRHPSPAKVSQRATIIDLDTSSDAEQDQEDDEVAQMLLSQDSVQILPQRGATRPTAGRGISAGGRAASEAIEID